MTVLTQLHRIRITDPGVIQVGMRNGELRGYAYWATNAWFRALSAGCQVVHFNGFPGQILSLSPFSSPKVVHVHNSLSMEREWWNDGGIRHNVGYVIASQAFRKASLLVCPTEVVKKDVIRHLADIDPSKIRVIPNCVDTEFYKRENVVEDVRESLDLRGKFVLLYFGKIKRTKGIETLCRAFQILKTKIDAALIIGGTFSATDRFLQYLRRTYADVIFTGFVKDPRPYYAAADVYSINTPGFDGGETFALSLAEAMSMGLPAICSDNPIFREVTKGNALFARPEDPQSLAEKLFELADDPSNAIAMGKRSRIIAERFYHVSEVVEQLEDAYLSVCA